jgi:hypothetical protein
VLTFVPQNTLPDSECNLQISKAGHTFIRIYSVHTLFLAGKSPYIRSYTVCIYGSGQPYN